MKNTFLKTIGLPALAILIMATFTQTSVSAQDSNGERSGEQTQEDADARQKDERALEGVWNVQTTRLNCQTGAVIGVTPAILTFTRGGTMSDAGVQGNPVTRGPGHGVWSHVSARNYSSAFQFFRFNTDGTHAGRQIVRQQIELSRFGSTFNAVTTAQVFDVNGVVTATNCSTGVGTRFE